MTWMTRLRCRLHRYSVRRMKSTTFALFELARAEEGTANNEKGVSALATVKRRIILNY